MFESCGGEDFDVSRRPHIHIALLGTPTLGRRLVIEEGLHLEVATTGGRARNSTARCMQGR